MIATHLRKRAIHAVVLTSQYATSSAGLNNLQVEQVGKKIINKLLLTQLIPSKLIAACKACIQLSGCGETIRAMPTQLLQEKPNKCLNGNAKHFENSLRP